MAVVAVFVKQNIGLALVIAIVLLALATRRWRVIIGVLATSIVATAIVALVFGIDNYIHWTITYAASRRLPPMHDLIAIYICPLDVESWLLRLWAPLLVCGSIAGIIALIRKRDIVPLLVIAAIHGAFLSQQVWGSTYGIWPLLIVVIAYVTRRIHAIVSIALGVALIALGIPYVIHNERLTYVKLDGERHRANLAPLRGLVVAGEWLPDFEELVAWSDRNIPIDDAILFMPGEDPFYFTTGRRPRFPVLMFDRTINPYDAATIARLADERHVRWVIIKQRLQINGMPMENIDDVVRRVTAGARFVSLRNYIVAERPRPGVVKVGTPGQAPGLRPPRKD